MLLVLVLEVVALGLKRRRWADAVAAILPGALIVLALRMAYLGDWRLVALPLTASFPAHLWDLRRRGWV